MLAPAALAQDAGTAEPAAAAAPADVTNCASCHEDVTTAAPEKHATLTCAQCHPNVTTPEHEGALDDFGLDKLCGQAGCHPGPTQAMPEGPHKGQSCDGCHGFVHDEFTRFDANNCKSCHGAPTKAFQASVHGKEITCAGCHLDVHNPARKADMLAPTSSMGQVQTCGECHDKRSVQNFRHSVHGQGVLKSGLAVAPTCGTCHGTHDIVKVKEGASRVSVKNVSQTCGNCHSFILARWKNSIHGQIFSQSGEWKAGSGEHLPHEDVPKTPPVCTSCHSGHETFDPNQPVGHLKMSESCAQCHPAKTHSYRDSFHGKATKLGLAVAATCADCHSPHEMLPAKDAKSKVHAANLEKTCGECHHPVTASFVQFDPHVDPTNPEDNPTIHTIWLFMTVLLLGVFGFFALHTVLWLQRAVVAFFRKELKPAPHDGGDKWVRRFRPTHMWIHLTIIVTFLALSATGLPLKFNYVEAAEPIAGMFGGLPGTRLLHRIAGVLTFAYGAFFLWYLVREIVLNKRRSLLFGWQSMVPNKKDATDLLHNLRWFFYAGPRPKLDRWAYWEKFDFFAVFWGIPVIGLSGLMLWFPEETTRLFPGWILNIAYIVHSDEALLATGFIFFFHFFHTHLRPEAFPLDPVMFTGAMPLERFKEERPAEYERLVKENLLEQHLVPPPSERRKSFGYVFGFFALGIGLLLGVFLMVAGLGALF